MVMEANRTAADVVRELANLADGWNGDDSLAASQDTVSTASLFASAIANAVPLPSVGLADGGDILFEWQFPAARSVFVRVNGSEAEVVALDGERDLIEISLSPKAAAWVALAVVADWSASPGHQAA